MLILGIETSGSKGSIAVCRGRECLAESPLEDAPRRHAQTLVSQMRAALRHLKLRVADLDAVAVSIGPGSFTGLRVGVVCAKTLAYAARVRLAAVDTLLAIAANSPPDVGAVHVIADAQRGELFAAAFRRSPAGEWVAEGPTRLVPAATWAAARKRDDCITGPGLALCAEQIPSACRRLSEEFWIPTARQVARLGARQIEHGETADCATLEPFYLRRSAAEEKADRGK